MNLINKKVRQELIATLEKHKGELTMEINNHAWEIKQRVEKQQVRKRKRQELNKMIHSLRNQLVLHSTDGTTKGK